MHSRTFTPFERMIKITEQEHAFNAVIVLHLTPSPEPDDLADALKRLQQSSPLLQARIESNTFQFDVTAPIPLTVTTAPPETAWLRLTEYNLNTRVDSRNGPLLRVDLLASEDRSKAALIFTFNHSIMDASSVIPLLHQFFTLLDRFETVPVHPPLPDITAALPAPYRGPRKVFAVMGFMAGQMADELAFLVRSIRQPPLPLQPQGECRIMTLELTETETLALVRTARKAGITLNSVLNAALAVVCNRELYNEEARLLRMITFTDLRPFLDPPVPPDSLGNAISMLRITRQMDQGMGLWEFAKRIHSDFLEGFRKGDKFAAFLMADRMVRMVIGLNRVRLGTTAMSFTGPVNLPESIGGLHISGINASISNNRFGPILSGQARLFRERLGIDLLYIDSDLTPTQAEVIRRSLYRLLTAG